jgi:hypothetical protein
MKIIDTKDMEKRIEELKRQEERNGEECLNTQQRIQLDPWYTERRVGR